jgi:cation:H+ antiporter
LAAFVAFLIFTMQLMLSERRDEVKEEISKAVTPWKMVIDLILGFIGILLGAQWIVESSQSLALRWGISSAFVGFTIVAVGTSLPELAASMVAAFKKKSELAVANVIGSNIFNVLFVLGLSAAIQPIPVWESNVMNWHIGLGSHLILGFFLYFGRKNGMLGRTAGLALLLVYSSYLTYLFLQQMKGI